MTSFSDVIFLSPFGGVRARHFFGMDHPDARPRAPPWVGQSEAAVLGALLGSYPDWRSGTTSHAFISGACYDDARRQVHPGTLGVPVQDQEMFNKLYAETMAQSLMNKISISELRTAWFPLFVDFDLESPITGEFIQFVLDLCKLADVGEADLDAAGALAGLADFSQHKYTCDEVLSPALGKPWNNTSWMTVLEGVVQVTEIALHRSVASECDGATVVAQIYTELRDDRIVGLNGLPEVLYWLYCAALTKLVQRVVLEEFVADAAQMTRQLAAMGLLSRSSDRGTIQPSRSELLASGVAVYKWGVHVHCRGLVVTPELALAIRAALRRRIDGGTREPPRGGLWRAAGFVDDAPYLGQTGGIRKPFCVKVMRCKCSRKAGGQACSRCAGSGKLVKPYVYGPGCFYDGSGAMVTGRRLKMLFLSRLYVVSLASVRVSDTEVSAGLKPLPESEAMGPGERRRREQQEQDRWLDQLAPDMETRVKRFINRQPSQYQPTLRAALMDYAGTVDPSLPTASRKVQYVVNPVELAQIETALGCIMGSKHKCYVGLKLKSVTRHTVGKNVQLYCFVRGPGACFCMNRTADSTDGAVHFGRVAALRKVADDRRIPGRHTKWANSVYFVFDWNKRRIVQRCNAKSVRPNRRNRYTLGASPDGGMCKNWDGEVYTLDTEQHRQMFGSLFGQAEAEAVQRLSKRRKGTPATLQ
jgi:hypothetical protein